MWIAYGLLILLMAVAATLLSKGKKKRSIKMIRFGGAIVLSGGLAAIVLLFIDPSYDGSIGSIAGRIVFLVGVCVAVIFGMTAKNVPRS